MDTKNKEMMKETTDAMLDEFEKLCEKYQWEAIDADYLKREIKSIINNYI